MIYITMIALILFTLFVAFIGYLWIKPYFSPLRHIPEPPSWPILRHLPYILMAEDIINLFERWISKFRDEGLFKIDSVIGKYMYFISKISRLFPSFPA